MTREPFSCLAGGTNRPGVRPGSHASTHLCTASIPAYCLYPPNCVYSRLLPVFTYTACRYGVWFPCIAGITM